MGWKLTLQNERKHEEHVWCGNRTRIIRKGDLSKVSTMMSKHGSKTIIDVKVVVVYVGVTRKLVIVRTPMTSKDPPGCFDG